MHMHALERMHVKDPVVHVRVRWIMERRKHCTQEKKEKRVAPYYDCARFHRGKQPEFPMHCIMGQEK